MGHQLIQERINKINELLHNSEPLTDGFLGGSLGLLYYYYHAGQALGNGEMLEKADRLLDTVFLSLNGEDTRLAGSSFSSGAAGFGYVTSYLQQNGFIDLDVDSEFEELDQMLFVTASELIRHDHIDYLHGGGGIIHYFSARVQTPRVNDYLNRLVALLMERAIVSDHGIRFRDITFGEEKTEEVNFSLSHGLSGILLLLINAYPSLQNKSECERIIREGIRFIVKHELPVDFEHEEYSYFPGSFNNKENEIFRFNRLAWCYGDLNEVLLLYRAGALFGDNRYTAIANRIGFHSVERQNGKSTFCKDAHFCHGTSGLAQCYKSLYLETNSQVYRHAYEFWIAKTIQVVDLDLEKDSYKQNNVSFLEGWAGIAMVLTDYLSGGRMKWDKALLL